MTLKSQQKDRDAMPQITRSAPTRSCIKRNSPGFATLWRTDQGPPQRIDRLYGTDDIAEALISLTTVVTDDVREASDHAVVVAKFSLPRLRRNLGLAV